MSCKAKLNRECIPYQDFQEYERKRSMIGRSRRCFCLVLKVHKYFQKNSEGFFLQGAEWGNEAMEMYITGTLTELNDEWQSYGGKRQARISGDDTWMDPPVPIPNTVVKHSQADGTWLETTWESRMLPVRVKALRMQCFFLSAYMCVIVTVQKYLDGEKYASCRSNGTRSRSRQIA